MYTISGDAIPDLNISAFVVHALWHRRHCILLREYPTISLSTQGVALGSIASHCIDLKFYFWSAQLSTAYGYRAWRGKGLATDFSKVRRVMNEREHNSR